MGEGDFLYDVCMWAWRGCVIMNKYLCFMQEDDDVSCKKMMFYALLLHGGGMEFAILQIMVCCFATNEICSY